MRNLSITLASSLALAIALAACGGGSSSAPRPTTAERPAMPADMCPVDVPGTTVTAEDTEAGGALVFVTTGDVAELRRRVAAMAAMHNEHHQGGAAGGAPAASEPPMHGMHGMHGGDAPPPAMMALMHSRAAASDIEGGARVDLAASPGEAPAVQAAVREHAAAMAHNGCALHGGHEHGGHEHGGHEHGGGMHHHD
jgi:hypothetical protein